MTMPSQKAGIDTPIMAPVVRVVSSQLFRLSAAMIPKGKPIRKDQKTAPTNSSNVTGRRLRNISMTLSPLPRDVPQSPTKKSRSQMKY